MTIIGSVKPPTETMSEKDTIRAFSDGARKACYAARELANELNSAEWLNVAMTLEAMEDGGRKLYDMKQMSRFETLMAANMKASQYNPH